MVYYWPWLSLILFLDSPRLAGFSSVLSGEPCGVEVFPFSPKPLSVCLSVQGTQVRVLSSSMCKGTCVHGSGAQRQLELGSAVLGCDGRMKALPSSKGKAS